MIYRMVFRTLRPDAPPEEIARLADGIRHFADVPGVRASVFGPNLNQGRFSHGTHVSVLVVDDQEALRRFLQSEPHHHAVELGRPITEQMVMADIELPGPI
jgi:Stress responsive A/B Barrel Domain